VAEPAKSVDKVYASYPPTMKPTGSSHDYDWRPDALEMCPYYFFVAGTDVVKSSLNTVDYWHEQRDAAGKVVGRHPCFTIRALDNRYWAKSTKTCEEGSTQKAFLKDDDGNPLVLPDHNRILRLHTPWSIPQFAGRLPQAPDVNTSPEEKAKWALFTMFLFRPWRRHVADARVWCKLDDGHLDVDARYAAIWFEYERWIREDLEALAAPCHSGALTPKDWPTYTNEHPKWWACMVLPRVRQFRFALQRLQYTVPLTTIGNVPVASDEEQSHDDKDESDGDGEDAKDGDEDRASGEGAGWDDDQNEAITARKAHKFPTPVAHLCTNVSGFRLGHDFFLNHPVFKTRSPEAYFAQGFRDAVASTGLNALPDDDTHVLSPELFFSEHWSPGESKLCSDYQHLYFKKLDAHTADIGITGKREKTYTKQFKAQLDRVKRAFATMALQAPMGEKTFTAVLEATFWLLRTGIVNVPGKSAVNVKQAIAPPC